ncbi:hypothetical protein AMTR_s00039p00132080 [Amborella trichopoda]|uniref:Uncharacterized protein n=1 Tax=Amborella trichopoda TaxID=13333 RepID=U5D617_AMBTC|nr:hypothetical protein AMTR_s00039p00132080 [Amborella trichopoda]
MDPLDVMVVDSGEEDLTLAFGDQNLSAQIEGEHEEDGYFDSNTVLTIYALRVIPHLEASPLRLLVGPSVIDDFVSEVEIFESDSANGSRSSARLEARGIIKSTAKSKAFLGKEPDH